MPVNYNKFIRVLSVMVVTIATIYFLYRVKEILFIFALGAFLAYILFRPVTWLESKGLKRVWSILLIYMLVVVLAGAVLSLILPAIIKELGDLALLIPEYASQAQDLANKFETMEMPGKLSQIIKENIGEIESRVYEGLKDFVAGLYGLLGKIIVLVFSPILAFYIMNDWEKIWANFLKLFSPSGRREAIWLFEKMDQVLLEFFKGYLLVATFVGVMVGIAAAVLGVGFPLLLGLIAGVTNLIPYFGSFLGGAIVVAVGLTESAKLALYIAVAVLLIQQIESNLVTPRVIGDRLGLHPLVIVFALLAGGELLGLWGMVFAVPIAAILKLIISWVYLKAVRTDSTND